MLKWFLGLWQKRGWFSKYFKIASRAYILTLNTYSTRIRSKYVHCFWRYGIYGHDIHETYSKDLFFEYMIPLNRYFHRKPKTIAVRSPYTFNIILCMLERMSEFQFYYYDWLKRLKINRQILWDILEVAVQPRTKMRNTSFLKGSDHKSSFYRLIFIFSHSIPWLLYFWTRRYMQDVSIESHIPSLYFLF